MLDSEATLDHCDLPINAKEVYSHSPTHVHIRAHNSRSVLHVHGMLHSESKIAAELVVIETAMQI